MMFHDDMLMMAAVSLCRRLRRRRLMPATAFTLMIRYIRYMLRLPWFA